MTQEQVAEKVKKLLRLSQSSNENEALLAQKRAYELMTKYQLSIDVSDLKEIPVDSITIINDSKFWTWKKILMDSIVKLNYCTFLFVSRPSSHSITIIGSKVNMLVTQEMYKYLIAAIEKIAQGFKGKKLSYKLGLATNISQRISDQREQVKNSLDAEKALIVIEEEYKKQNSAFIKNTFPRVNNYNQKTPSVDYKAYLKGMDDGDKISINKQIEEV